MQSKRMVPFKITSIDGLGQGVSKESDKITFIPKTAVGDIGNAEILAEKKQVAFARALSFSHESSARQTPECGHFLDCPSCHFLHLPYEVELTVKRENLEKILRHHKPKIEVVPAVRRLNYRNRVQLHYDLISLKLGMLDIREGKIVPVPNCKASLPVIEAEIKRLYADNQWLKEAPATSTKGHVEIYWKDEQLKVSWNRPYAEGGFTQVFEEMNEKLKLELQSWSRKWPQSDLVDLFAGGGNLAQKISFSRRLCIDLYPESPGPDFLSLDLYGKGALAKVVQEIKKRKLRPQILILDPPRSGMKELGQWLDELCPEHVAYVSCDPHTLARDIAQLKSYTVDKVILYDFFPSTFHFETLLFLKKKH